jgi:hypothetical protein
MNKLQLSFHTTFPLKKAEIAKIVRLAASEGGLPSTLAELVDQSGFGTKKAGPVKSWATRAGLIRNQGLTEEGRVVVDLDPALKSAQTDWLMHSHLSFGAQGFSPVPSKPADWGGWPYFVFQFLLDHRSFTLDALIAESELEFSDGPKLARSNFPFVLRAYTDPDALSGCGFLRQTEREYHAGEAVLPSLPLVAYLLAKLWARDFGETSSVLTDSVLDNVMGLGPLLGIGRHGLLDVLDQLASVGFIDQRRTVAPYQIVRRWGSPIDLLRRAYE